MAPILEDDMLVRTALVSLFLSLAPSLSWAGCKAQPIEDDFSEDGRLAVSADWISFTTGGATTLEFPLVTDGAMNIGLGAGAQVQLKLDDGSILDLRVRKAVPPEMSGLGFTRWPASLDIEPKAARTLADARLVAVRFVLADGSERTISERTEEGFALVRRNLQKAATCAVRAFDW